MIPSGTQTDKNHAGNGMMGGQQFSNDQVMDALLNSHIVDNLQDEEIKILAGLISGQFLEAKEYIIELQDEPFKDALMILVDGDVEISARINDEPVSIRLESAGDLARVVSFVGGSNMDISAKLKVREDSVVLLLQRSRLETLLHTHPAIPYWVMRNLVLHMHGLARRKNDTTEEITEYVYRTQAIF